MLRPWLTLAVVFVLAGAGARAVSLASVPRLDHDLNDVRSAVVEWIESSGETDSVVPESLRQLGVQSVRFEVFDPDAIVYMQPGPDGQPGVAGVDDNGNGIVDDNTELGATRTDDVCMVSAGKINPNGPVLILQTGAFVEVPQNAVGSSQWRAVVEGRTGDESWSFVVN